VAEGAQKEIQAREIEAPTGEVPFSSGTAAVLDRNRIMPQVSQPRIRLI